jgi:NAD(P)-dependent dehydrogenase (short-subunit alcohol dehydrogenase family)
MEHSIALVTGATSGLGQAAARLLAEEGWREIIVTGRSLAGPGTLPVSPSGRDIWAASMSRRPAGAKLGVAPCAAAG